MFEYPVKVAGREVTVQMHDGPHFDEILAFVLFREHATPAFVEQFCPNDILQLGIEGGPFDEHARDDQPRKGRECTVTLIARALGVDKFPGLNRLIRAARFSDIGEPLDSKRVQAEEVGYPFGLHQEIQARTRRFSRHSEEFDHDPVKLFERNLDSVLVFYYEAMDFAYAVFELKKIKPIIIERGDLPELKMVMVSNINSYNIEKAARYVHGADVVVHREPSGHVHISTNRKSDLCLDDAAQMINYAEQKKEGSIQITDWATLRREGSIKGGRWYYDRIHGALHNSTESYPDVPATQLTDPFFRFCLTLALNPNQFYDTYEDECRAGRCTTRECPLYKHGLQRCREVRYKESREKEKTPS